MLKILVREYLVAKVVTHFSVVDVQSLAKINTDFARQHFPNLPSFPSLLFSLLPDKIQYLSSTQEYKKKNSGQKNFYQNKIRIKGFGIK